MERSNVAIISFRNSLAYMQRYIDTLLRKHHNYCHAFIDNIVIFSDTTESHIDHFKAVFDLFIKKNIFISAKKSFLVYFFVGFLNFYINVFGLIITKKR